MSRLILAVCLALVFGSVVAYADGQPQKQKQQVRRVIVQPVQSYYVPPVQQQQFFYSAPVQRQQFYAAPVQEQFYSVPVQQQFYSTAPGVAVISQPVFVPRSSFFLRTPGVSLFIRR